MASNPRPNPVAPVDKNALSPLHRRLPLGRPQQDPGGAPTHWHILVPTVTGGLLTVEHAAGSALTLEGESLAKTVEVAASATGDGKQRREKTVLTREIPADQNREPPSFTLTAHGGAGEIVCTFTQTAWSRQAAAPEAAPLIPWNFYYWDLNPSSPFAKSSLKILDRYGKALGPKLLDESFHKEGLKKPSDWEAKNHLSVGHDAWAGHCHLASPVSALLVPPGDLVIGGETFHREEVKLLAAEFFGNFGRTETIWELSPGNNVGSFPLLAYFRPGEPKTAAALRKALHSDPAVHDAAELAAQQVAARKGEQSFARSVEEELGGAGARLYQTLLNRIRDKGEPLSGELRSYSGGEGPVAVWNEVYFYFHAEYVEADGEIDRVIDIRCTICSNIDRFDEADLPATISQDPKDGTDVVKPGKSGETCQLYEARWRIVFDSKGGFNPEAMNTPCRWLSHRNHKGEELYAPRELVRISALSPRRRASETPLMDGNPVVGRELLDYLPLQPRYESLK